MSTQLLDRDEYIEQVYFFRTYRERIEDNMPAQEALRALRDEVLATTCLPMVIDFLVGELNLKGKVSDGMQLLPHYFTPFQTYIVQRAEQDESRFDMRVAMQVLEHEAEYRAEENPTTAALFVFQFECLARNRLGYDQGMLAIAADPGYDEDWRDWISKVRRQLGTVDFADLIYLRSQHRVDEVRRRTHNDDYHPSYPVLFGVQEGRIAKANRGKDPLYMFAALQRHLGYPRVPRPKPARTKPLFEPHVEMRFQRLESKLAMLDSDLKGSFDLSDFYEKSSTADGDALLPPDT